MATSGLPDKLRCHSDRAVEFDGGNAHSMIDRVANPAAAMNTASTLRDVADLVFGRAADAVTTEITPDLRLVPSSERGSRCLRRT